MRPQNFCQPCPSPQRFK